jgi:hypothetical protein
VHVLVHVARGEVGPRAVRVPVAEEAAARRGEQLAHERGELGVDDHLALPHALLADVVEHHAVAVVVHVALEQRADAERLVLLGVAVAADAEERLADEPHHPGAHAALGEALTVARRAEVLRDGGADAREVAGHLPHAVELAELPHLGGALVVAVLLATLGVVPPRLHRGAGEAATCTSVHAGGMTSAAARAATVGGAGLPDAVT